MIDGGPFVTITRLKIGALGITLSIGHGFTTMSRVHGRRYQSEGSRR